MSTFVLTWNSERWEWPPGDYERAVRTTASGGRVSDRWSVGARKQGISIGDRAFLLRQRSERGIVASGVFISEIEIGPHWDGSGGEMTYAEVEWDTVVDLGNRLPVEVLNIEVPEVHWDRMQGSGVEITADAAEHLERLWTNRSFTTSDRISRHVRDGARVFGELPGVPVGTVFVDRTALSAARVHRPLEAGISGSETEGADSIVVSGGYEDDVDLDEIIIYTGHGGKDVNGRVISDQQFKRGNRALARSCDEGLPVRVVRGSEGDPNYSPESGYRYDGIYTVERYWSEPGRSGFRVWRFRMVKTGAAPTTADSSPSWTRPVGSSSPSRAEITVQRIIRNTSVAQWVKRVHQHECQVCGQRVETLTGPYSEGCHIRPLGQPHSGPDVPENVLCLCPNDHVRFDSGSILIDDNLDLVDGLTASRIGSLRTVQGHEIGIEFLRHHRSMFTGAIGNGAN